MLKKIQKSMLDTDVQNEFNKLGVLTDLQTANKGNLVGAVNEVTSNLAQKLTFLSPSGSDDTTLIQNAINNSNEVILRGTFTVTSTITVPEGKSLTAKDAKILANSSHFTVLNVIGSNVLIDGLEMEGAGNSAYNSSGRLISCAGADNGAGVAPTYINNIKIRNCKLHDAGRSAVRAQYVDGLEVTNCDIRNIGYAGVEGLSCKNSKVNHNEINDITFPAAVWGTTNAYGVFWSQINNSDTIRYPYSINCETNFNHIKNTPWEGLDTHGGIDIQFIGNTIETTPVGVAIIKADDENSNTLTGAKRITVANNRIKDCTGFGVALSAVDVANSKFHSDITITNNIFSNCGGNTSQYNGGIKIQNVKGIVVNGNSIFNCYNSGILLRADTSGCVVNGNTIRDIISNSFSVTAAISIVDNNINAAISGNYLLDSAEYTGTYMNQYGLRIDSASTGVYLELGQNNFESAKTQRYLLTSSQATNINPPITQRGKVTITTTTDVPSKTVNVTLPKKYSGNTLYEPMATIYSMSTLKGITVTCSRVDVSNISVEIKTSDGLNFASAQNVNVTWMTSGF